MDEFTNPMTDTVAIETIEIVIDDLKDLIATLSDRSLNGRTDQIGFIISSLETVDAGINPA